MSNANKKAPKFNAQRAGAGWLLLTGKGEYVRTSGHPVNDNRIEPDSIDIFPGARRLVEVTP